LTTHLDRSARPFTFPGPTRQDHPLRPGRPIAHQVVRPRASATPLARRSRELPRRGRSGARCPADLRLRGTAATSSVRPRQKRRRSKPNSRDMHPVSLRYIVRPAWPLELERRESASPEGEAGNAGRLWPRLPRLADPTTTLPGSSPGPHRRRQACPLPTRIVLSYLTLWPQRSRAQAWPVW
jgi:hypothetical protein